MTSSDPLLQPFQLRHLTLRNRIMSTSHEPAYAEDGKPKLRYQLYHEEKAKGGIALSMFGGSTNVAPDSPPVFGQLYAGDDDRRIASAPGCPRMDRLWSIRRTCRRSDVRWHASRPIGAQMAPHSHVLRPMDRRRSTSAAGSTAPRRVLPRSL